MYFLRKWQRFPPKACSFLERYQKNQKNILDSSGLAFAKTPKSLFFHQEMATFSTKSLQFPGDVPKKNKDFGLRPRLRQASKIFVFFGFWYLLRKWHRFPPKACSFLEGYQKPKKPKKILDSSGLALAKTLKSLLFCFFGTSSGNGNVFHQKLAKKNSFGLFRPRLSQDTKIFVFFFLGTSSGNGNVFHQKLAVSWRGTKNQKKQKRFWTLQASP